MGPDDDLVVCHMLLLQQGRGVRNVCFGSSDGVTMMMTLQDEGQYNHNARGIMCRHCVEHVVK